MYMKNDFNKRLEERLLVFDGAMGTELYKKNFFVNTCFDELCLRAPEVVREIHSSYVVAGADVIITNSFGANSNKLSGFGLNEKMEEINRRSVEIAREVCKHDTLVAGSVGPLGSIPRDSSISEDYAAGILYEQACVLAGAGADLIAFETITSLRDTLRVINAAARLDIPFILSFSLDRNAETRRGEPISRILDALEENKIKPSALGLNCGVGPVDTLSALEVVISETDLPIIVQPNAGLPKDVDGRMIYMVSPEYFSTYAMRFVELGAAGVGGCCGTCPEHIRDLARTVKPLVKNKVRTSIPHEKRKATAKEPVPTREKSDLGAKIAAGKWVTTVEIVPPRGFDLSATVEKAVECRKAGVDAINIPDGPRASSRISPLLTSLRIQELAEIESILHFCCRDKNVIGMQAELLGCAAVGINNILFITGDPPKLGDYPFASGVFDLDSIGIVEIQKNLNSGIDVGGKEISMPTRALIGVGADPNAIDPEKEYSRLCRKVEAGAEFVITQPVFSLDSLLRFLDKTRHLQIPMIAGIWPLASLRNAEFMNNEVPGVSVPDEIMIRMASKETRGEQLAEGISIARECIDSLRDYVQGVQVSAPFGNVQTAISVLHPSQGSSQPPSS